MTTKVLERLAGNNPELLTDIDHIPDPPDELTTKGAEYYYQICTLIQKKGKLNKVKCLCAASLASDAVQMATDPFYFQPVGNTDNPVVQIAHEIAEYNHIVEEVYLTAKTIDLTLQELNEAGIPLLTMLQDRKNKLNQTSK